MKFKTIGALASLLACLPTLVFAGHAQAYANPTDLKALRMRLPAGVVGSLGELSSGARIAAVGTTTTQAAVAGSQVAGIGVGTAVAGTAVAGTSVALAGLGIGYYGATWIGEAAGWLPDEAYVPDPDVITGVGPTAYPLFRSYAGPATRTITLSVPAPPSGAFSFLRLTPPADGGISYYAFSLRCNDGFISTTTSGSVSTAAVTFSYQTLTPTACGVHGTPADSRYSLWDVGVSPAARIEVSRPPFTGGPLVDEPPNRYLRATWSCDGVSAGSADSVQFQEADDYWPAFPGMECVEPATLTGYIVIEKTVGGVIADKTLATWDAPTGWEDFKDAYPECGDGTCLLELFRVTDPDLVRVSCFNNPSVCEGWFESPTKVDDYVCTYGGTDVALSECNSYSRLYDDSPSGITPRLSDPADGSLPDGLPSYEEASECPPDFGLTVLTPWFWYKSATCALEWAFVPDPLVMQNKWSSVETSWGDNALGTLWGAAHDILDPFTAIGQEETVGCEGFGIDFSVLGLGTIHPMSVCDPVSAYLSPYVLMMQQFALISGMVLMSYRTVLKNFGGETTVG